MSRRKPAPRFARTSDAGPPRSSAVRTNDNVVNAAARLGLGTDNITSGTRYDWSTVSWNRQNLDNAYRGSWLVGVACDAPADDMTRAGVEMMGDIAPADIEKLNGAFSQLCVWQELSNTIRWARLYGGAIAVMLIDGQNPSTPLRIDTIRQGQFQGLLVLDRWMITPSMDDIITEFGPEMGKPRYYRMTAANTVSNGAANTAQGISPSTAYGVPIHYTRCIRLDGAGLPFFARQSQQGWGQSVIERLYDRLVAYDSTSQGAAQLAFKAHLRTLYFKGLREAVAFGGKAIDGITAQINLIRKFQTNDGITALDAEDRFDASAYNFDGLPELMSAFGEQIAGALQIPLVRLFGQSPSGFSTGDTDLQNYYDAIASHQERGLRRPVQTLLQVMSYSTLGRPLTPGFGFKFAPLWQMSAADKAEIASKITAAVVSAQAAGIISQKTAMQELRQASYATGVFTNITDEDIAAAESDPPTPGETGPNPADPGLPGHTGTPP